VDGPRRKLIEHLVRGSGDSLAALYASMPALLASLERMGENPQPWKLAAALGSLQATAFGTVSFNGFGIQPRGSGEPPKLLARQFCPPPRPWAPPRAEQPEGDQRAVFGPSALKSPNPCANGFRHRRQPRPCWRSWQRGDPWRQP